MFAATVMLASSLASAQADVDRRLRDGEIIIATSMVEAHDDRVLADAILQIEADRDAVWSAILDFPARVRENWVEDVSVYHDATRRRNVNRCARWDLKVMGVEISYHTTYTGDLTGKELSWMLDGSKDNDLNYAAGTYRLESTDDDDRTRLHYTFTVASKHKLTAWLRRRLTRREVKRLLDRIRSRAEANG